MKSVPLVSVLVPVYNGARFLDEALRSAQRQSYRNLEVLIRDDGSNDGSREIAESYCARDRRFRFIPSDGRRLGGTGNMVELLELASGEFIKYLHQDDLLEPTCVERLVRPLRFDQALTMATSSRRRIDSSGELEPTMWVAYEPLQSVNGKLSGTEVVRRMATTLANQLGEPSVALFRNGVVEPHRAFVLDGVTYSYMNDMALWTNLLLAGDLFWYVQPLSSFRVHETQRSGQLTESLTVAREMGEYVRFGMLHGFIRTDTEFVDAARKLTRFLSLLEERVAEQPADTQAELMVQLSDAVAAMRDLLEVRASRLADARTDATV